MTREEIERYWFRVVVIALMVGGLTFGAVPLMKSTFFPVEKSRA